MACLILASPSVHAAPAMQVVLNSCLTQMLSDEQNAKLLISHLSGRGAQKELDEILRLFETDYQVHPGSNDGLVLAKAILLKRRGELAYRFDRRSFFEVLDVMIQIAKDPTDRLAALQIISTSEGGATNRRISDQAMKALWQDFEKVSREHQERLLLSMTSIKLSPAQKHTALTHFYRIFSNSDGLVRILSALNILLWQKATGVPVEIIRAPFPGVPVNVEGLFELAPSGIFRAELLAAYHDLYFAPTLQPVDFGVQLWIRLIMMSVKSNDPQIQAIIDHVLKAER
jgi:hypothetical protein